MAVNCSGRGTGCRLQSQSIDRSDGSVVVVVDGRGTGCRLQSQSIDRSYRSMEPIDGIDRSYCWCGCCSCRRTGHMIQSYRSIVSYVSYRSNVSMGLSDCADCCYQSMDGIEFRKAPQWWSESGCRCGMATVAVDSGFDPDW